MAFNSYRCCKRGGGVTLYFKKDYKPYLLDVPNYAGPCDVLAVQSVCNDMQWVVVHHPPLCTTYELMQLFDYGDELLSKYPTASVMSNFNVSELDWSSGQPVFRCESNVLIGQCVINILDSFELLKYVIESMRENSFLDLVFTSVDCISHIAVLPSVRKCDHDMVLC